MKYIAHINVMPLKELLDPQGKAVNSSLHNLGLNAVDGVRIGKHITMDIEAGSKDEAARIADDACKKLLANLVMEQYDVTINEA
ncbi:MAG: phosphoribosylformylglycinamidine synthase subunit PurS [Chitinophagales bacterium]|nr:phosphoribosylformylglycinamidine synthase subunit PurS [Chitinophagaceae bacterium]MCB9064067.1 phosphoribosylformylglycinamidine synthase subunit PurS [Chitinophagales bacterium]